MKRHRFSASKRELAGHCLWWADPDNELPEDTVGPAALIGTAFHTCAERTILACGERVDPFAICEEMELAPEHHDAVQIRYDGAYEAIKAKAQIPGIQVEVKYAYSKVNGRILKAEGPRDYSDAKPWELVGTVDIAYIQDGTLVIEDWKTGRKPPRARWALQLHMLGAAAHRAMGALGHTLDGNVRVVVLHVLPDGTVNEDSYTLSGEELQRECETLDALLEQLGGHPEPKGGDHCTSLYCPARRVCPSTQGAMLTMPTSIPTIMTMEDAASWRKKLDLVRAAADALEKELKQYVDKHGDLDMGDGRGWGPVSQTRDKLTLNAKAFAYLKRKLNKEKLEEAAPRSISKSSLKKALGSDLDKTLEHLTTLDAVEQSTSVRYQLKKYVPRED